MKKNILLCIISSLLLLSCNEELKYDIPVIKTFILGVIDQNNIPVTNYPVKLYSAYRPSVEIDQTISDYSGTASFGSLAPGNYIARVFEDGTLPIDSIEFTVKEDDSQNNALIQLDGNAVFYDFSLTVMENLTFRTIKNRKVSLSLDAQLATVTSVSETDDSGIALFEDIADYQYYINVYDEDGIEVVQQDLFVIGRSSANETTVYIPTRIIHNADFVITGMMVNLKGYDCKEPPFTSWGIEYPGEFEYIQFMSLRDIDFTVEPYCMVTCWNGTPTTLGWVEGKNANRVTYQININYGSVKKGEFFIVGGRARLLCGINEDYISPSISADKWIIAKNFYSEAGDDGNGSAVGSYGILDGGGEVDGVAVFRGTSIDESSVPMDAVFFGSTVSLTHYYQIPDNDLYCRVNPLTGEEQPYFSSGTNTKTMGASIGDVGDFYLLGGTVTPEAWISPRVADQHVALNWKTLVPLPQLSNIESGSMVTKFVDE